MIIFTVIYYKDITQREDIGEEQNSSCKSIYFVQYSLVSQTKINNLDVYLV